MISFFKQRYHTGRRNGPFRRDQLDTRRRPDASKMPQPPAMTELGGRRDKHLSLPHAQQLRHSQIQIHRFQFHLGKCFGLRCPTQGTETHPSETRHGLDVLMVHHLHLSPPLGTAASACTHHVVPTTTGTRAPERLTGLEMQPLLPVISKGQQNEPNAFAR